MLNPDGRGPIAYFGKVFRIPKQDHDTIRQLEWEMDPKELIREMHGQEGKGFVPAEMCVIERTEIYDQDSGDVWVMYRIPYTRGEEDGGC